MSNRNNFMQRAIELAKYGVTNNLGGPFGAVVVRDNQIIGEGYNTVTSDNDPTAHAEVMAIRNACKHINSFQLENCQIYSTCEPCPMCLGAIYWARISKIFIASDRENAAEAGFDDDFIYKEIEVDPTQRAIPMSIIMEKEGNKLFRQWIDKEDKTEY